MFTYKPGTKKVADWKLHIGTYLGYTIINYDAKI